MKARSNFIPILLLVAALTLVHVWAAGRCGSGFCLSAPVLAAQQGVSRGPVAAPRNPELEVQSLKSLDAARYYLFRRKAGKGDNGEARLKAVEDRLQEIIDLYPQFTRMDQVYYLLGEVYFRSGQKEKAADHFNKVIKDYSDSEAVRDAKKRLAELEKDSGKVEKKKEGKQ